MKKIDEKNLKNIAGGLDTKLTFDFQSKEKEENFDLNAINTVENKNLKKYNKNQK